MKTLTLLPLLLSAAILAACSETHQFPGLSSPTARLPDNAPLVVTGRTDLAPCGGDKVAGLIGGPVSALPPKGGWGALRVLSPGMMMTMDYSDTRLNVNVDGAGVIVDMSCG